MTYYKSMVIGKSVQLPLFFKKKADNTAFSLVGKSVYFAVKALDTDLDADAILFKKNTSHLDAINGITVFNITPSDWKAGVKSMIAQGFIQISDGASDDCSEAMVIKILNAGIEAGGL